MKISVALCTYNGEKYLNEQLNSIFNQSLSVDEIIICDDKSTDTTIEIIKEYQEKHPFKIKLFQNETNLRSVKNFEKALNLTSGDVIFLSDQDDIWVHEKVEKYVAYFYKHNSIKVLASNGYCIDDSSSIIEKYSLWDIPEFLKEKNIDVDYFKLITYFSNIATGASMALKKEILIKVLPFPIIDGLHHDEWIAIIASSTQEFTLLNEKYFYYRIHNNQQVGGVFFDKNQIQKKFLIKHFNINHKNLTFNLLKRKLKKLQFALLKNRLFLGHNNSQYDDLFNKNIEDIIKLHKETKTEIENKYPILYFFLKISDKIQNKRQFNS